MCVCTLLKEHFKTMMTVFKKNCKLKKFKIYADTILKYYQKIHSYYLKEYQESQLSIILCTLSTIIGN